MTFIMVICISYLNLLYTSKPLLYHVFSSFFISFVSIYFFHLYCSFIFKLYWNIIDEYNHKIFKGYICWLGIHTDCEKIPRSKLINIFISSHISPIFFCENFWVLLSCKYLLYSILLSTTFTVLHITYPQTLVIL